jgi:hypothetical protein
MAVDSNRSLPSMETQLQALINVVVVLLVHSCVQILIASKYFTRPIQIVRPSCLDALVISFFRGSDYHLLIEQLAAIIRED